MVNSKTKRKQLIRNLKLQSSISFDTETDGLDIHKHNIVGMSFCWKAGTAYYVPLPDDYKEAQKILQEFECVFTAQKEIVGHNLKFDLKVLKKYEIPFAAKIFDTMLAHYLLFPDDKKRKMDLLVEKFLKYSPIPIEVLIGPAKIGNKKQTQKTMHEVDFKKVCDYAAEDADVTFQLKQIFEKRLIEEDLLELFTNVECKLIPVLVDMEYQGITIDEKRFAELAEKYKRKMETVEKEIHIDAGEEFNISSTKRLGKILFKKLRIDYDAELTKSGAYSTSASVLKKLRGEHPIITKILTYRNFKSLNQKATKLPELVSKRTGRLHTNFNQSVAATGRLSSSHPNLQSLPSKDYEGKLIREAIVPSKGNVLILADYSQVELRIMAYLSKDKKLIASFKLGEDIHAKTAAKLFGIPVAEVSKKQREIAKTVNFGINYGMGAKALAYRINIETGSSYDEFDAQEWIDVFFEQYCGVEQYMQDQIAFACEHDYTETMMGRKRYFPEIIYGIGERNAINFSIQGTAADILKVAMINTHVRLKKENLKAQMVLTVHDEIVIDTPVGEKEVVKKLLKEEMESAITDFTLIADVEEGKNWLDAKDKPELKTEPAAA